MAFAQRTVLNREVKRLDALVSGLTVPDGTPAEEVPFSELVAAVQAADAAEHARTEALRQLEAARLNERRLDAELTAAREYLAGWEGYVGSLPPLIDTADLQSRLDTVDETNAAVRTRTERDRLAAELVRVTAQSAKLTKKLESIDASKSSAMAEARMPLPGLSFDSDGVLYGGIPFSQASGAERLRVGIAMAMALNPKIRVIRITDGSLLDSENLALIEEMAAEHDFQVWLERVDETGTVGITIEDGQVVVAT